MSLLVNTLTYDYGHDADSNSYDDEQYENDDQVYDTEEDYDTPYECMGMILLMMMVSMLIMNMLIKYQYDSTAAYKGHDHDGHDKDEYSFSIQELPLPQLLPRTHTLMFGHCHNDTTAPECQHYSRIARPELLSNTA